MRCWSTHRALGIETRTVWALVLTRVMLPCFLSKKLNIYSASLHPGVNIYFLPLNSCFFSKSLAPDLAFEDHSNAFAKNTAVLQSKNSFEKLNNKSVANNYFRLSNSSQ